MGLRALFMRYNMFGRQINIMFQLIILVGLAQYAGATSSIGYMILALIGCTMSGLYILRIAIDDFHEFEKEVEEAAKKQADAELKQSELLEQVKEMNIQLDKSIKEINDRNAKKASN